MQFSLHLAQTACMQEPVLLLGKLGLRYGEKKLSETKLTRYSSHAGCCSGQALADNLCHMGGAISASDPWRACPLVTRTT